jgi:hypothetical protein
MQTGKDTNRLRRQLKYCNQLNTCFTNPTIALRKNHPEILIEASNNALEYGDLFQTCKRPSVLLKKICTIQQPRTPTPT